MTALEAREDVPLGMLIGSASNRNEYRESSWGLMGARQVRLTTSPPSVIRAYRKCESLDVSQPCACYRDSFTLIVNLSYNNDLDVFLNAEECLEIWSNIDTTCYYLLEYNVL
jgi:hypothetical protein